MWKRDKKLMHKTALIILTTFESKGLITPSELFEALDLIRDEINLPKEGEK